MVTFLHRAICTRCLFDAQGADYPSIVAMARSHAQKGPDVIFVPEHKVEVTSYELIKKSCILIGREYDAR